MKRLALILAALLTVGVAHAQTPSPANMGIDKNTPQNLSVLDSSQHWAQLGTVDPVAHTFTPLSGGGGSGCGTTSGTPCYVAAISGAIPDIQAGTAAVGTAYPPVLVAVGVNSSGVLAPLYQADQQAVINVSAAGTSLLISAVASKRILVTGFDIAGTGTGTTAKFEYGTHGSADCDTGTTVLTGPYPSGVAISRGGGLGPVWTLPATNQVCLVVTGTTPQFSGSVSYTVAP
jgi:hypothetical protein